MKCNQAGGNAAITPLIEQRPGSIAVVAASTGHVNVHFGFGFAVFSTTVVVEAGGVYGGFPGAEVAHRGLKQGAVVLIDIRITEAFARPVQLSYRGLYHLMIPLSGHALLFENR